MMLGLICVVFCGLGLNFDDFCALGTALKFDDFSWPPRCGPEFKAGGKWVVKGGFWVPLNQSNSFAADHVETVWQQTAW